MPTATCAITSNYGKQVVFRQKIGITTHSRRVVGSGNINQLPYNKPSKFCGFVAKLYVNNRVKQADSKILLK